MPTTDLECNWGIFPCFQPLPLGMWCLWHVSFCAHLHGCLLTLVSLSLVDMGALARLLGLLMRFQHKQHKDGMALSGLQNSQICSLFSGIGTLLRAPVVLLFVFVFACVRSVCGGSTFHAHVQSLPAVLSSWSLVAPRLHVPSYAFRISCLCVGV